MIRVQAMPGELAAAHARRYGSLNRIQQSRLLGATRSETVGHRQTADAQTMLEMLACMSNMSAQRYASAHSMLPVMRVAQRQENLLPYGSASERATLRQSGMYSPKPEGYICADCVKADQLEFGFSWYRREHHLFGIDWCPHHESVLLRVTDPDPLSALPHSWLKRGAVVPARVAIEPLEVSHDFVQRLIAISTSMLRRSQPISTSALHGEIRARSARLGLRRTPSGRKPPLSWLLKQMAPSDWVQWHMPGIRDSAGYCRLDLLDDFVKQLEPATGRAYLVTMACLFESVGDVLRCFPCQSGESAGEAIVDDPVPTDSVDSCP